MKSEKDVSLVGGDNPLLEKLTDRQRRFCDEYLLDLNQTSAYVRAGYSPKEADANAARLMGNESIRTYIDQQLALQSRRTGVTAARVVRELARLSFASPAQVVMEDGSISPDASEDDLAAIQSIKVKTTHSKSGVTVEKEVRFHDKNKSLELLGRHLAMFVDKKQIDIHQEVSDMSREEMEKRIDELERKRRDTMINITPQKGDNGE